MPKDKNHKIDNLHDRSLDNIYSLAYKIEGGMNHYYNDARNVPTIGIGYAAVVRGRDGRWVVKPTLEEDMKAAKISLGKVQKRALQAIAGELNKGNHADKKHLDAMITSLRGPELREEQTKALFERSYRRFYDQTREVIGDKLFATLSPKRQGILTLATYQSPASIRREQAALRKTLQAGDMKEVGRVFIRIGKSLHDESRGESLAKHFMNTDERGTIVLTRGDTTSALATRYHTTVGAIMAANPDIGNANIIRSGDLIYLPHKAYLKTPGDIWGGTPPEASPQSFTQPPSGTSPKTANIGAKANQIKTSPGGDNSNGDPVAKATPAKDPLSEPRQLGSASDKVTRTKDKPVGNGASAATKKNSASLKPAPTPPSQSLPRPKSNPYRGLYARTLVEQLSALYGDKARASKVLHGSIPEQMSRNDFFTTAKQGIAALNRVVNPTRKSPAAAPEGKALSRSRALTLRPTSKAAKTAGLLLDETMAKRVMTSRAYGEASHPLNTFAANAVRAFYKAAYADNTANAPTRATIDQEPGRARTISAFENWRTNLPFTIPGERRLKSSLLSEHINIKTNRGKIRGFFNPQ